MITIFILITTILISILYMDNHEVKNKMYFTPYQINHKKEWWRFFTGGIIHADFMHLAFNMFALWMFGRGVESAYRNLFGEKGILFFILLYVGGLAMSSIYTYERHKNDVFYNALGASGAVSAVVFAYIILAPTTKLMLLILPIPVPAYLFGFIYLGVEYYLSKRGEGNIGHDAHFWGAIYGALLTIILKPSLFMRFINLIIG